MHQTRSASKNTGLLVSVRNAEEATIALESKCISIIDLKEPTNGSLGCVSIETAKEVLEVMPEGTMNSIALGEVSDWPIWPQADADVRLEVLSQFDFAKAGLSGLAGDQNWVRLWRDCFSEIPDGVERVAVAYADSDRAGSPSVNSIIEASGEAGCSVLLIDTFCKQHGGLLDLFPLDRLTTIVCTARAKGLKVVLAGSLDFKGIETARSAEPDFVAVRGAVCSEDRTSTIEARKIQALSRFGDRHS